MQWGNPLDFWNQLLQLQKGFLEDSLKQSGFSAATAYMIVRECGAGKINAACTGMAGPEPLPLHLWDNSVAGGSNSSCLWYCQVAAHSAVAGKL